jgi:ferrous iron transport protein A
MTGLARLSRRSRPWPLRTGATPGTHCTTAREGGPMKLRELAPGQRAVVTGYAAADPAYRAKLLAMGLTRGVVLTLVRVAPLGDPVKVEVRGYSLSLRKAEADALDVEPS